MTPNASGMPYRPDIDGLRAVAVLSVLFCHAGLVFPGGYVGVDVFFVISGYLITSLILKDLDRGTFSLADFWVRRIRRILPALLAVTAATALAGWFLLIPSAYASLGKSIVGLALLVSNVQFCARPGTSRRRPRRNPCSTPGRSRSRSSSICSCRSSSCSSPASCDSGGCPGSSPWPRSRAWA